MTDSLADTLRSRLQDFLASGMVEIRDAGGRISPNGELSWEVRGADAKPLLHLWTGNCNLTRRVVSILDESDSRVALAVERFGRHHPDRLELVRVDFQRGAKTLSRKDFCERLRRILAEQFPDEEAEKLSIATDLAHTFSGAYVRGISRKGNTRCAFLAVPEGESVDAVESSLTYALLWLDHARQTAAHRNLSYLRLILPQGQSAALAHRLGALTPQLAIRVYELNPMDERITRVEPRADGNVTSWLVPHRESQELLARSLEQLAPIIALAPDAITPHPIPAEQEIVLRFRGLPFVRWSDSRVFFGVTTCTQELSAATEGKLRQLVRYLQKHRDPSSCGGRHALFRAQAERWMQSLVAQDLTRIDLNLDPAHLYEQVFAHAGGQHGVLDLLTITRSKRLAILELKASENPDLPLQAADYWLRVRRHLAEGHFAQYGYFAGMQLQTAAPLVYLVAPALRFHPTTDTLLQYLSPEMEVVRVGLAETWRRGIRVVMRQ